MDDTSNRDFASAGVSAAGGFAGAFANIAGGRATKAESELGIRQLGIDAKERALQREKSLGSILGEQLLVQGSSGFGVGSDSFRRVREASVSEARHGQAVEDLTFDFAKRRLRLQGEAAERAGVLSGVGTLLDTALDVVGFLG